MNRLNGVGRAVAVVALLAVGVIYWLGCDGNDNPGNNGGSSTGGDNTGGINTGGNNTGSGGGSYDYVELGGLKWMKKNLNVSTSDSWCYNDSPDSCNKYGRLYTWSAAKSACQSVGWRLPTREDWNALVDATGGSTAGKALKSTSGWYNFGAGTDSYGFSALPGGYRYTDGRFYDAGDNGSWWTATERGSGSAYYRDMYYYSGYVGDGYIDVGFGFSARCVAD